MTNAQKTAIKISEKDKRVSIWDHSPYPDTRGFFQNPPYPP